MYIVDTTQNRVPYLREQLKLTVGVDNVMVVPCTLIIGCHVRNATLGVGVFLKK